MPLPFSSGGKRNVLPIRSAGSKVGVGLDPDGFSSSLALMKTVGVFCFGGEPHEVPSGDPEEILSSEGSEDVETCPPCGASLWLGVEVFLGLTALLKITFWVSWSKSLWVMASPQCSPKPTQ